MRVPTRGVEEIPTTGGMETKVIGQLLPEVSEYVHRELLWEFHYTSYNVPKSVSM